MVAVTTARPTNRPVRRSPRPLQLLPPGGDDGLSTGVPRAAGGAPSEGGRCGCRRHRASAPRASRPSAALCTVPAPGRVPASTYRRRWLVASVVVAGLVLTAWAALGALGGALTASGRSAPALGSRAAATVVEVAPGDTLWSIARRLQPSGDVRPLVDRLAAAHGGTVLQVGERLVVPSRR